MTKEAIILLKLKQFLCFWRYASQLDVMSITDHEFGITGGIDIETAPRNDIRSGSCLKEYSLERKYRLKAKGIDLDYIANKAAKIIGIDPNFVWSKGRQSEIVQARSLFCYWATKELGVAQSALSKKLELAPSAISLSVERGRELVRKHKYNIEN